MNKSTSSPENGENTPESEIFKQRQSETCTRLEKELIRPKPTARLMPPEKFALEDFLEKYPCLRKR
ncbi:hypothetical protein [Escherichia coli]|uniref:hypothetical protein n=1 Tax=Escherichia coli TaxID=562 RepID=UPI000CFCDF0D|nr:hypothetical protein [Escherichia coli]